MFRRGRELAAALVVLFLLYLVTRRSSVSPPRSEFEHAVFKRVVVAIGDIHSYYPNAVKALQLADVIDDAAHWTGRVDFFAQTGDVVDRGPDTIKLYRLLDRLRAEAKNHGGAVLSHLGNHEFMNILGDWRFVHATDLATFKSVKARQEAFSSRGWIGKTFHANYTVTSRLPLHPSAGDDPYGDFDPATSDKFPTWDAALSFVHGGIHPQFPFTSPYPSHINGIGKSLVQKAISRYPLPEPHPPGKFPGLPSSVTSEEQELYGTNGPLWYRGWAEMAESKQFCNQAEATIRKMGVRRMIMGHTPSMDHIVTKCDGKVIIIDTAMTPAYGGVISALKIEYGLFADDTHHVPLAHESLNGTSSGTKQWRELEVVRAIYVDRVEELIRKERRIEGDFGGQQ